MLSGQAKPEWLAILAVGAMLSVSLLLLGYWPAAILVGLGAVTLTLFFRDPNRQIPAHRGVMIAPADGTVSSVHDLEHFEPFDGPAVCVRIFMSVFDVHINRCPGHGRVKWITYSPGKHRNTLNPEAAEDNESKTTLFVHPVKGHPVFAVRQIAGLLARTIHNTLNDDQVVQRGQRMGLIKLGSTTELYLPASLRPEITVKRGQKVLAGLSVLANITPVDAGHRPQVGPLQYKLSPERPAEEGSTVFADQ